MGVDNHSFIAKPFIYSFAYTPRLVQFYKPNLDQIAIQEP
jgi:hypothetical protein